MLTCNIGIQSMLKYSGPIKNTENDMNELHWYLKNQTSNHHLILQVHIYVTTT